MHASIFTELAVIVTVVVALSVLMKLLRQPLIMGYFITGVLVGPTFSFFHI